MFAVALLGLLAVWMISVLFSPENERFATNIIQLVTIMLIIWHNRHIKTTIEPKVDQIAAVTTRKLGERVPTDEHEPWDGTERRGSVTCKAGESA